MAETRIETAIYPLMVERITYREKTFNLIQDTDLPAGTKQRGIAFFQQLVDQQFKEVVTYGTVYGYGQVATAWCCREIGLSCTIFLPETLPRTRMTKEAIICGANIIDVQPDNGYPTTSILAARANKYASLDPKRRMIELGLDDPDFIRALANGIINGNSNNIQPKRIWVAGGSGVLSRAIAKAFKGTHLSIVQVGRLIYPNVLEQINYTMYVSPETFRQNAEIIPPYKSLKHYDAKVWRFVQLYGEDGDYIWNVK